MEYPPIVTPGDYSGIIVAKGESDSIKQLIKDRLSHGNNWIVFNDGIPIICSHHLQFFKTDYDVHEFIHENATDRDFFSYQTINGFGVQLETWENIRNNPDHLNSYLETKMKNADWNYKDADQYERFYQGEKEIDQIRYLLLAVAKEQGQERADILWNENIPDNNISKPDFLTKNNIVMTEQEMMHAKKQYGKIGIVDGFDDSNLITRMKNGDKEIKHKYGKEYAVVSRDRETVLHRDEVKSDFHWKKLNDSNLYFLNKWELTVKPDGHDKEYKRTFYINDLKRMGHVIKNPNQSLTTFTFKSSVNYLCGRPVLNTYSNQNGKQFKAWDQLFPDVILPNGKMKERTFHENYGFDLQKVAANYNGMKDLTNAEYANRLYQSLERGNLQLESFVGKDGREESYFITPNIQVGCFDLLTTDKKPVSLEMQVEKGYITQEFAQKVHERLDQIKQEKNTLKQEKDPSEQMLQNGTEGKQIQKQNSKKQKESEAQPKKRKQSLK